MMRPLFLFFLLFLSASDKILAQVPQKPNSIYLEFAGNGILYSLNYDYRLTLSNAISLAPRAGFTLLPKRANSEYGRFIIPLEINGLWHTLKNAKNHLEFGLGMNLTQVKIQYYTDPAAENKWANVITGRLGFRHQKPQGGFMYRAGLILAVHEDQDAHFKELGDNYFGGLSIGYTF